MPNWLNKELPGHKWFRGTSDILLEWREPPSLRKSETGPQLRWYLKQLPKFFLLFSLFGFGILLLRALTADKPLVEANWLAAVLGSLLLGTIFSLMPLSGIAIRRWNPVTVRLASRGLGRWTGYPKSELHLDYTEIRAATLCPHPQLADVSLILLTLKNGEQARIALPAEMDLEGIFEVLSQNGITCNSAP